MIARLLLTSLLLLATPGIVAQGMPPEARENIHTLFDQHATIRRSLEITERGYVATTESEKPEVTRALQEHVRQMEDRLESGLMVRRWDPAFEEYVRHYRDMDHKWEKTAHGVRMTVVGRTSASVEVARNHARVISEFVRDGWTAHDRRHPAVSRESEITEGSAPSSTETRFPACGGPEEPRCGGCSSGGSKESAPGCCQSAGANQETL